jgi:hypothetical protein
MSKIAIGIVSNGRKVELSWSLATAKMFASSPVQTQFIPSQNSDTEPGQCYLEKIASSRQRIAERAVAEGYEFLFFLDDDIVCLPDTLKLLHEQLAANPDAMICGGIYPLKMRSLIPLVFGFDTKPMFDWKPGEVFPCKILATGCMLIRTKVFESLEKPWFKYAASEVDPSAETEDSYFCRKVVGAGFTILAHAGVLPDHVDQDGRVFSISKQGPNREMKRCFGL